MTKSDITFDASLFNPDRVPQTTSQINAYLISQRLSASKGQDWWDVSLGNPPPQWDHLLKISFRSEQESFAVCNLKGKLPGQHQPFVHLMAAISKFPLEKAAGR